VINLLINTYQILNLRQRLRLLFVSIASILTGILEMLSIALFIPLVGLLINKDYLNKFSFFENIISDLSNFLDLDIFYILILLLVIIFLIKNSIILFLNFYSDKSAYNTRKEIGDTIMKNYLKSNYEVCLNKNSSIILYMLTEEISRFGHMLLSIIRLFTNILITLFIFVFIFYNYPNQLIILIFSAVIGGGIYYLSTKNFISNFGKRRLIGETEYHKNLRETLDFFREVKIYFKENFFSDLYNSKNQVINKNGYIWAFFQSLPKVWFELVAVFSLFAILSFNYSQSLDLQEIVISLSVMIYAIARTLPSVNIIISSLQNLKFSEYGFNQLKELINLEKSNIEITPEKDIRFEKFQDLEIKSFSFNYPDKEKVIDDVNLKISKGEIIGIIGESGSGKSTLVNLITGLLKPKNGLYFLNGHRVKNIREHSLNLFGYIPQKLSLLDESIKHNITLSRKNVDDKKLADCIEKSGLKSFISNLDKKEDTFIGEKGSNLSGGQGQRLAIARALYNNPEVLILDESTNSLDTELEKNILKMLKNLNKSLIIISHSTNALSICNKVYKLQNQKLNII
jgi:ABC-type multidrug transport system fused ATPase/permease subunit